MLRLLGIVWIYFMHVITSIPSPKPTGRMKFKARDKSSDKMLTPRVLKMYHAMLAFGCNTRLAPYSWNSKGKCLSKASNKSLLIYYLHFTYNIVMNIFSLLRLAQALWISNQEFPLMVKILNFVWAGAYSFTSVLLVQFEFKKDYIRTFVNALLYQLDNTPNEVDLEKETKSRKNLSMQVIIALSLLAINPLCHALVLPTAPCSPHFFSSLTSQCQGLNGSGFGFLYNFPFFLQEYYGVTLILYTWSFNWSIIFLGLAWISRELRSMRQMTLGDKGKLNYPTLKYYRNTQLITSALNFSMLFYLTAFPTMLFIVLALLLFGCIRLWHIDPRSNFVFPSCGIRCSFESMSPLAMAGKVNKESKLLMREWKHWKGDKVTERFKASCKNISCTAGSMYSFENSIIITSLHNLNQLTLNLLIAFK